MTTSATIIHVVDDDASIRRALRRLLEARGHRVELYESASDFLSRGVEGPGCVVLDLQMPDISGLQLLQQLAGPDQVLRVIILSGHADVTAAVTAMKLGAIDLLTKPVEDPVLCATVKEACRLSSNAWTHYVERRRIDGLFEGLTTRELEVAWMVSRSFLNKQVAYDLGIAEKTVKAHRGSVMRKLNIQSAVELARLLDESRRQPPDSILRFLETAAEQARLRQESINDY